MKLLFCADNLRIRLSPREFELLGKGEALEQGYGREGGLLACRIEPDAGAAEPRLEQAGTRLSLCLGPELIARIPEDAKHGISFHWQGCEISLAIDLKRS